MIDTITLIGRSPSSRHYIEQIEKGEKVYTIAACYDLAPWIDACVEIHHDWMLRHERYNLDMLRWLQEARGFPIYMQRHYEDIPESVPYPREEVLDMVRIMRGDKRNDYACSSFDWLMGLAILHQPKRIKVIGYDMSSETEYRYQRESATGWMYFAAGRGIEVWLPPECKMIQADMLYGFEGAQAIKYERLVELHEQAQDWMQEAEAHHKMLLERLPRTEKIEDAEQFRSAYEDVSDARDTFFINSGVVQAIVELRERFTLGDIITRQELETQRTFSNVKVTEKMSFLNFWEGVINDRRQRYEDNRNHNGNAEIFLHELQQAYGSQNTARDEFFTWKGGLLLLDRLISECDLVYNPDWRPVTDIRRVDVERI